MAYIFPLPLYSFSFFQLLTEEGTVGAIPDEKKNQFITTQGIGISFILIFIFALLFDILIIQI